MVGWAGWLYIVDEPDQADNKETDAVEAEDEEVRGPGVLHGVLLVLLGLLDEEAQDQQNRGEDGADAEGGPPDGAEMLVVAGRGDDVGHEGAKDEPLCMYTPR